jgi:hypothetical protein
MQANGRGKITMRVKRSGNVIVLLITVSLVIASSSCAKNYRNVNIDRNCDIVRHKIAVQKEEKILRNYLEELDQYIFRVDQPCPQVDPLQGESTPPPRPEPGEQDGHDQ